MSKILKGKVKSIKFLDKAPDKYGNTILPLVTLAKGELIGFRLQKKDTLSVIGSNDKYVQLDEGDEIEAEVEEVKGKDGKTYFNGQSSKTTLVGSTNVKPIRKGSSTKSASKGQFYTNKSGDNSLREHGPAAGMGTKIAIDALIMLHSITNYQDFFDKDKVQAIQQLAVHVANVSNNVAIELQSNVANRGRDPLSEYLSPSHPEYIGDYEEAENELVNNQDTDNRSTGTDDDAAF